eukprot:jgi/Ulvmu1/10607/UM065_0063.1
MPLPNTSRSICFLSDSHSVTYSTPACRRKEQHPIGVALDPTVFSTEVHHTMEGDHACLPVGDRHRVLTTPVHAMSRDDNLHSDDDFDPTIAAAVPRIHLAEQTSPTRVAGSGGPADPCQRPCTQSADTPEKVATLMVKECTAVGTCTVPDLQTGIGETNAAQPDSTTPDVQTVVLQKQAQSPHCVHQPTSQGPLAQETLVPCIAPACMSVCDEPVLLKTDSYGWKYAGAPMGLHSAVTQGDEGSGQLKFHSQSRCFPERADAGPESGHKCDNAHRVHGGGCNKLSAHLHDENAEELVLHGMLRCRNDYSILQNGQKDLREYAVGSSAEGDLMAAGQTCLHDSGKPGAVALSVCEKICTDSVVQDVCRTAMMHERPHNRLDADYTNVAEQGEWTNLCMWSADERTINTAPMFPKLANEVRGDRATCSCEQQPTTNALRSQVHRNNPDCQAAGKTSIKKSKAQRELERLSVFNWDKRKSKHPVGKQLDFVRPGSRRSQSRRRMCPVSFQAREMCVSDVDRIPSSTCAPDPHDGAILHDRDARYTSQSQKQAFALAGVTTVHASEAARFGDSAFAADRVDLKELTRCKNVAVETTTASNQEYGGINAGAGCDAHGMEPVHQTVDMSDSITCCDFPNKRKSRLSRLPRPPRRAKPVG